jgi:hypothetical protein
MAYLPDEIEKLALLGWCIFPGSSTTRSACFKQAHRAATHDLDQLEEWAKQYPKCSWRVVFGPSGLCGFDLDVPPSHADDGVAAFKSLVDANEPLPTAPALRTGSGGIAIFFRHQGEKIVGESGKPLPGIDPRRGLQSQTIPPSTHHRTKQPYRWVRAPWDVSPPPLPEWLARMVRPADLPPAATPAKMLTGDDARNYAVAALRNATGRAAVAGSGGRNSTLNREAFAMARFVRDGSLMESEVRECMMAAARANGLTDEDGIRQTVLTIESALRSGRAK